MKKFIFICGTLLLILAIGLRAYFAFVPPPEATLEQPLAEIFPAELNGWKIQDQDMAASPESSNRISEFLNFDDALFRTYEKNSIFIGLYVAYWKPGTASYRWAGAHTPDTCWIVNGWTCSERQYAVPFTYKNTEFQPAEFGVYEKDGSAQSVYFWHLVGGKVMTYDQKGTPQIFGALVDIQKHGLNLRQEQFFIRLSSNRDFETLRKQPAFSQILNGLSTLGL